MAVEAAADGTSAPSPTPAAEETKAADPATATEAPAPSTEEAKAADPVPAAEAPAAPEQETAESGPALQQQQQKGGGRGGVRLHVKNLGPSVTTEQLKTIFQPFGQVLEAEAKSFDDGRCKGFGFVVLSNMEEANKAVAEANGTKVEGEDIIVFIVDNKKGDKGGKKGGKADGKGGDFGKGKGFGKDGKGKGKKGKYKGATPFYDSTEAYMQGAMPYGYAGAYQNPSFNPYNFYNYPAAHAQVVAAQAAWWQVAMQAAQSAAAQMQGWSPQTAAAGSAGQVQAGDATAQPSATPAVADATPSARGKGGKKGRGRGRSRGGDAGTAEATPQKDVEQPVAGKDYRGSLKSMSEKHGYGFIQCEDAKMLYDRDVWVESEALPENAKVGARVVFNMSLSSKGHPQAQNVRSAE